MGKLMYGGHLTHYSYFVRRALLEGYWGGQT